MKNNFAYFTAGELAKIHNINKRTLHFYDEAGVFSPKFKGQNGYRYYTIEQSMELENILTLRELNISIEEIRQYISNPNSTDFNFLASKKIDELDKSITRLKHLKADLLEKTQILSECEKIYHGKIELIEREKSYLLLTPLNFNFDSSENLAKNSHNILEHLKKAWTMYDYRKGCGSYISMEKVKSQNFTSYDGIFSVVDVKRKNLFIRPKGRYLRGFCVGDWDNVPEIYHKMLQFAKENNIKLSDYAFEIGLNEFAIKSEDEYITQIEILCENN